MTVQPSRKEIWLNRMSLIEPNTIFGLARHALRRRPREFHRIYRMTIRKWQLYLHRNIVFEVGSWMGVPVVKNPLDSWIFQEIIFEVRPDVIVEIGSAAGGTTLFCANLLDLLGNGSVISVDIDHSGFKVEHDRITKVTGDSLAPETIDRVTELCRGRSVLVIHDGDHNRRHVLKDLEIYSALVAMGSYIIVEDGIVDLFRPTLVFGLFSDGGPLEAIEEFLSKSGCFIADRSRERYLITNNPKGYLKRVS
jgi:cephalosporin hydroxylase